MKHLGDITKIDGNTVPIVDCVIGGSPCQDLSIAGLRAGLEGKRSGLFMEQIRIVKEIREHDRQRILNTVADDDVRPRYMVWENVRGALSSPGGDRAGEDFRCVLEEVARVSEESVTIPRPPKGKWPASGVIIGDTYSIAWRLFDAQWWGVPQRRSRICLVADFNGHTAADIVFSRGCQQHGSTKRIGGDTSVSDFGAESRSEVSSLGSCVPGNPESCRKTREGSEEESSDALRCADVCSVYCFDGDKLGKGERSGGSGCGIRDDVKCYCLTAKDVHSVAYTMQVRCGCEGGGKGVLIQEDKSATLSTSNVQTLFQPVACNWDGGQISPTLTAKNAGGCQRMPDKDNFNCVLQPCYPNLQKTAGSLMASGYEKLGTQEALNDMLVVESHPYTKQNNTEYTAGVGTLKACGGDIGGGSETLIVNAEVYRGDGIDGGQTVFNITGDHENRPTDMTNLVVEPMSYQDKVIAQCISTSNATFHMNPTEGIVGSLRASDYKDAPTVTYAVDCRNGLISDVNGTLQAKESGGTSLNLNNVVMQAIRRIRYIVRRLTPLECTRLQGYPDGWVDIGDWTDSKGKKHKANDSEKYRALGNSIALPSWAWVLERMAGYYDRPATMASLFSGIGGFDFCWTRIHGKGTVLWESEIEEFPIAVTKRHFGDEDAGTEGDYEDFF